MRTPLWESSSGALAALLNSGQPVDCADLYTLTLAGGAVYRWTDFDRPMSVNGNTWTLGPGIERSRIKWSVGIPVDTLQVTLTDITGNLINGLPLMGFIAGGGLQNATLKVDRAFFPFGSVSVTGTLVWFVGRVAEVTKVTRHEAELMVKSPLELLDVQVPREVYQPGCLNTVYDPNCGADRSAFTVAGGASSASSAARTTFSHTLAQPAGWFDLGVITFTSGLNAGISRTVKQYTASQIVALQPWPFAVASGDAFSIYPGCDKTLATCTNKFNRKPYFRGMPYIPVAETVT